MTSNFAAGLAIIVVSGILNASFAAPLKKTRAWQWENMWLVFSALSLFALPAAVALWLAPGGARVYGSVPWAALLPAIAGGFFWGTAQVTFGIGINLAGMAVAFAVVGGLCAFTGSVLVMAILQPAEMLGARGWILLAGTGVLAWGLLLYARAARERDLNAASEAGARPASRKGVALCVYTGIMGGALNMGFASSTELVRQAGTMGISQPRATLLVWLLLLSSAAVPNVGYPLWLLVRNRTLVRFRTKPVMNFGLALLMAVLWLLGTLGYGLGATVMGGFGTSIGYALYLTLMLLWSTILGVLTKEWAFAGPVTLRTMKLALLIIVAAVLIFSCAGLF
jgi:L-rhamnose-H+ transport protein